MVKYFTLLCMAGILTSCSPESESNSDGHSRLLTSYIPVYHSGELANCFNVPNSKIHLSRNGNGNESHCSPETAVTPEGVHDFMKIATRNNDLSYNKKDAFAFYCRRICNAENFTDVHVVCLNADWDATHPAGTPLDDLATLSVCSYANYIRNGYEGEKQFEVIKKAVADFTPDDLSMIHIEMTISFKSVPKIGETYDMKVTFIDEDGTEKSITTQLRWESEMDASD